jgi:hypothetical protein
MVEHGQSAVPPGTPDRPYAQQPYAYAPQPPTYGQQEYVQSPYPQQPFLQQPYPPATYAQPQYQYVYVPVPPPPRRRRRALWMVPTSLVAVAALLAAAWFVPPLIWTGPALAAITHPGPTSVDGLIELLAAPTQATVDTTEKLSLDDVARAVAPRDPRGQSEALRDRGFRWAVSIAWTGDDGQSKGTLRLTQFRTVKGARLHYAKLLGVERGRLTAEETSIEEVPGAALFTDENRDDGEIVRATFGRGVITGEIAVTEAGRHVRNDVLAQVVAVTGELPDDPWEWTEPPVAPIDLDELLLSPPSGARDVTSPEEFKLRQLSDAFVDAGEGEEYLQELGFQRGLSTGWTQSDNVGLSLTLLLFHDATGANDYTGNNQREIERHNPSAAPGETVPGVTMSRAHYYTYEGVRVGVATFYRGNIAVELYLLSSRAIDKEHLVTLAQQLFERLPVG